jgi:hypothetical protein
MSQDLRHVMYSRYGGVREVACTSLTPIEALKHAVEVVSGAWDMA